jgi:signal transduction histidine kinase
MRIHKTLVFRLTTLYCLIFAASVGLLFTVVWFVTSQTMTSQIAAGVRREAVSLADEYRDTDAATAAASIERRLRRGGLPYYLLQDASGAWIAGNIAPVTPILGFVELQVQLQPTGQRSGSNQQDSRKAIGYGLLLSDGTFVLAADNVARLQSARTAIETAFAVAGGISTLIAILGGLLLSGGFLRRIEAVNRTAAQIVAGNLNARAPVRPDGDEIDSLAANFNAMLDRIKSLMDNLQQVSSDVAHDLRTPLARLRQHLEQARTGARTVDEFRSFTDAAIAETQGLLETFSALLRIAQIESGARKAGFSRVDISELFELVASTFQPVAEDEGRRLLAHIEPSVIIAGDRELLLQLMTNLVENAIRHTPPGTTIELQLKRDGAEALAVVADDGPGIPRADRQKVFRRFYRLESSRTTPGSGLGLALVAAIAELHDASISLHDRGPGLSVELRFPALAAATTPSPA